VATIDRTADTKSRDRIALGVLAVVLGIGIVVLVWKLWPTPQMGADEEVFRTVDALFTAVTARDEKLLRECEQRLHGYRDAGRLPKDAARQLDNIIAKARAGSWQVAAERLYAFMRSQRRERGPSPSGKPPKGDVKQ
jgi:hypothetical protein